MSKVLTIGNKIVTIGSKIAVKTISVYDLPGLKLWLKANDVVKDGSNYVSQWNDNSGNGFNPIQTTGVNQPLWVDNELNGHPIIRFDGVNDFLDVDFGETLTQPNTIFIVAKSNNARGTIVTTNSAYNTGSFWFENSTELRLQNGGQLSASGNIYENFVLYSLISNDTSSKIIENGIELASGSSGTNGIYRFAIGTMFLSGWYLNGDIAEIIYCNSLLTTAQRQFVENYLMNKYNLTT